MFPEGNQPLLDVCAVYGAQGLRVLVLAASKEESTGTELPKDLKPLALFLLTDVIREDAPETLAFFDSQGEDLKVISGDGSRLRLLPLQERQDLRMRIII